MSETRLEKSFGLKLTAMICCSIMGIIGLIGIFWGKDGLRDVAIGLGILMLMTILIVGLTSIHD